MNGTTRHEHIAWAKERALQYADAGDMPGAIGSLQSDLGKHPETRNHDAIMLSMTMAVARKFDRPGALREFIEGIC